MAHVTLLDDILELADLLRPAWAEIRDGIPDWHPRNDGDAEGAAGGEGEREEGTEGAGDGAGGDGAGGSAGSDPDWKTESRKHERRAKQSAKRVSELEAELDELRKGQQTDQEKALEQARKEARDAALAEAEQERRSDRLEVAVTRAAARGVKVGAGDDAKTLKFADPEDALVFIERAIAKGQVDADDIFDSDGTVQAESLEAALADILERKPSLAAGAAAASGPTGSSDAGRGGGSVAAADMGVEEHLKAIRRSK